MGGKNKYIEMFGSFTEPFSSLQCFHFVELFGTFTCDESSLQCTAISTTISRRTHLELYESHAEHRAHSALEHS